MEQLGQPNQMPEFTEQRLRASMTSAMRLSAALAVVLAGVLLFTLGWQSAVLALVGALISASGLWEWQKLVVVISAKMDAGMGAEQEATAAETGLAPARPSAGGTRVIVGFFIRLLIAAGLLYGSLKCFHGSVFALLGGLAVAVLALGFEAVRLMRS